MKYRALLLATTLLTSSSLMANPLNNKHYSTMNNKIATPQTDANNYQAEIAKWRTDIETRLKADSGWLTVAGLFWLKEGNNTIGTASNNDFVMEVENGPKQLGRFEMSDGKTTFYANDEVTVTIADKPIKTAVLTPDTSGNPEILVAGDISMFLIKRGVRYGIRLKDKNSHLRKEFKGRNWYPVNPALRVEAKWVQYDTPKPVKITGLTGDVEDSKIPGYAVFTIDGKEYRLEPEQEEDQLFFNFKDLTSGKTTYGAGRFLYTSLAKDGKVVLDFNKAYNPPCAFTPYATCPLTLPQNRLAVKIEAGELDAHPSTH